MLLLVLVPNMCSPVCTQSWFASKLSSVACTWKMLSSFVVFVCWCLSGGERRWLAASMTAEWMIDEVCLQWLSSLWCLHQINWMNEWILLASFFLYVCNCEFFYIPFLLRLTNQSRPPFSAMKPTSQTNRFSVDAWAKLSMAVFKEKLDWCIVLTDGCMSQINYWCPQGKTWLIHCTCWSVQWLCVTTVCHTQTCMWEHVSTDFFFIAVLVVKAECPHPPKEPLVFTKHMKYYIYII